MQEEYEANVEDFPWECFICGEEADFELPPSAWLSNSHPLCLNCADAVLSNLNHLHRARLTFHHKFGDISIVSKIPISQGKLHDN